MQIDYSTTALVSATQIIALYNKAGLPRPTNDADRIQRMYEGSNLIVTAWHQEKLVGVSRSITDGAWCCYLADLAVDPDYKQSGIGKKLVDITRDQIGEECMLLLLSVPTAFEYYPKIGFLKEDRAFSIARKR